VSDGALPRSVAAKAWLDADGYHVWQSHECREGVEISMLPSPPWHVTDGGRVHPSVLCDACSLHAFLILGDPPGAPEGAERITNGLELA